MFYIIIVLFKCVSCIIWWVYIYAFDLSGKVLLKGFQSKQVVSVNEHIAQPGFPV